MRLQNIKVFRICQRILEVFAEEIIGVVHEILVKWIILSNKKAQRFANTSAATTCLLPGAGNASRIADKLSGFKVTDINSQFQGSSSDNTKEMPVEQLPLNLSPVFGKITCSIRLDQLPQRRAQLLP